MMKKLLVMLLCLTLPVCVLAETLPEETLPVTVPAEEEPVEAEAPAVLPPAAYTWSGKPARSYDTETLKYTIETANIAGAKCYITKVWMLSPGQQIKKATAVWRKRLAMPADMAASIPGAALAVNGSGYVCQRYPEIPDNYPGTSPDYYYTPLGSVTVTDGEVFRKLDGVPYYGLTLETDGLRLHVGDDPEDVLASAPSQTWSFYELCPMIAEHQSILDHTWPFALRKAARTVIARIDANNYVLMTVTSSKGLTLVEVVDFLMENFDPEWAYDLDGGPSSALLARDVGKKKLKAVYGGTAKDADMMVFIELPAED